jgi:hypothetical protein
MLRLPASVALKVSVGPAKASAAKVSVLPRRTAWTFRETTLRQRQELGAADQSRMMVAASRR